jgi:hypothetical protein
MLNSIGSALSLIFSAAALVVSLTTLYFNHLRKYTKALLLLNSRLFGLDIDGTERELSYTISNLGNQEIYVKEINYFYGNSPLGPFFHNSAFLDFPSNCDEVPMIVKQGEIKMLTLKHKTKAPSFNQETESAYKYRIISLEVYSANGKRYSLVHDITELTPSHVDLAHPVWMSVGLKRIKMRKAQTS